MDDVLQSALAGDPQAILQYMAQRLARLRGHGRGYVPPQARARFDTEDVFQEAMAGVLTARELPRFANQAQLDIWIGAIVRNELRNLIRDRCAAKRAAYRETPIHASTVDALLRAPGTGPLTAAERADLLAAFEAAVTTLADPADRDLVRASVLQGVDWTTIGSSLGVSADAARKRFARLLVRLAPYLRARLGLAGASGLGG
jgi:RNA polymerase sigma factor (sigma-70 family)